MNEIRISKGTRVESDGHYATVKFVGEVPPTSGIWVGVEWEDPSRGKHDGCYEGVRYFSTEHPTAGSFLRPKKCNFGVSFMMALVQRYGRIEDEKELTQPDEMYVLGTNTKTQVEWVGAGKINLKQSQFREMRDISMRALYVNGAGDEGDIAKNTPNVKLLNLSISLISSWMEVARITRQMPLLQELDVSSNRLELPENEELGTEDAFTSVKTLYANHMNYDWNQVVKFLTLFKQVQTLLVCYNHISRLENCPVFLEHLVLVNLEGNQIENWENVLNLSELKLLETLILNRTELGEISFPDGAIKTKYFQQLSSLWISNNRISDWSSINELNKLNSLTELRFLNNPLVATAGGSTVARQMIIAKLAKIKTLNSMAVTAGERRGAEIDYIKMNGLDWKNAGGCEDLTTKLSDAFVAAHPRYLELIKKYGAAEDSEMKKAESSALKNSLITVKIKSPLLGDSPPLHKKLLLSMTVQKLKAMVQRMFRIQDQVSLKLTYLSKKIGPEIELNNNLRDLAFYSVEDGDTICVHW